VDYLIDAKTFLPLRRLEVRPEPEGEVIIEYAEFKDVDGVKLARSVRRTNRTQTRKVELDKVELNADLPDARFQRPSPGPGPAPSGGS
jgi:hypothetical protein